MCADHGMIAQGMEIARSLRDERGGGDIISVESGGENDMVESEKKVEITPIFECYALGICNYAMVMMLWWQITQ